jgi:hypothetical protein
MWALLRHPAIRRNHGMQTITAIGLDIAKSVFQVHGVDADRNVVGRRQLKRRYVLSFFQKLPSCPVGIETYASSHYWSHELQALGHTARLMPPAYVKPPPPRTVVGDPFPISACRRIAERVGAGDSGGMPTPTRPLAASQWVMPRSGCIKALGCDSGRSASRYRWQILHNVCDDSGEARGCVFPAARFPRRSPHVMRRGLIGKE